MDEKKQMELIMELSSICEELGWVVAIPSQEEKVPGLIIGTEEFVQEVVEIYYGDDVEIYKKEMNSEGMEEVVSTKKKKVTDRGDLH